MLFNRETQATPLLIAAWVLLGVGLWMLLSTQLAYRSAVHAYAALDGAATAEFVIFKRYFEVEGIGKAKSTHYWLQVTGPDRRPSGAAPRRVEVSQTAYHAFKVGDRLQARMDAGRPVFDPQQTRYQLDRRRDSAMPSVCMIIGAILMLVLHAKGWIYRPSKR